MGEASHEITTDHNTNTILSINLNLKQGTSGELFGYGYLPLPLATAKSTTAGQAVPTGDQSWTLF